MSKAPQPMPKEQIITLLESQIDTSLVSSHTNGSFSVNLKEQIILNDGDQIAVRNAFIDTTTVDSDYIEVKPNESEATITHGLYFSDSNGIAQYGSDNPVWLNRTSSNQSRSDGRNYILQNQEPGYTDTTLYWNTGDNPEVKGATAIDFDVTLEPAPTPTTWDYDYIFQGGVVHDDPALENAPIQKVNIQDCALTLVNGENDYFFKIFAYGYVPVGSREPGANDHIATLVPWTDGNSSGWKSVENVNTTYVNPGAALRLWKYAPGYSGLNYFSDKGAGHYVELKTGLFAFDSQWEPDDLLFPPEARAGQFPAIMFNYYGQDGNLHHYGLEWYAKAYEGNSLDPMKGQQEMIKRLGRELSRKDVNTAPSGAYLSNQYKYFRFTDYTEPFSNKKFLPPIIYDITPSKFPYLSFYYPGGGGSGMDTGWLPEPHFKVRNAGTPSAIGVVALTSWNLESVPVKSNDGASSVMTPRTYKTKITIPPATYTYSGLAQTITDLLNKVYSPVQAVSNDPDGANVLNYTGYSGSRIFTSTYDLAMSQKEIPDGSGKIFPYFPSPTPYQDKTKKVQMAQPFWVSEDGNYLFQHKNDEVAPFYYTGQIGIPAGKEAGDLSGKEPAWCGASTLSVIWDDSSNQFKIAQAHSSIYSTIGPNNEPGEISVTQFAIVPPPKLVATDPDPPYTSNVNTRITADKAGGIFITNMEPASLFIDKMKFNPSMFVSTAPINPQFRNFKVAIEAQNPFSADFLANDSLLLVQTHQLNLIQGQHITGLYVGNDALVTKNLNPRPATMPVLLPQPPYSIAPPFNVHIGNTTPSSLNGNSIIVKSDDDPYYQIEISGINNSEVFGQPNKNNLIQSIVGKYYTNGNFSQSSLEDGFAYYHKGAPLVIKSLRVRILNSVGNPQPSLGPNSAVILQVTSEK